MVRVCDPRGGADSGVEIADAMEAVDGLDAAAEVAARARIEAPVFMVFPKIEGDKCQSADLPDRPIVRFGGVLV